MWQWSCVAGRIGCAMGRIHCGGGGEAVGHKTHRRLIHGLSPSFRACSAGRGWGWVVRGVSNLGWTMGAIAGHVWTNGPARDEQSRTGKPQGPV